jgi:hypothetical protein
MTDSYFHNNQFKLQRNQEQHQAQKNTQLYSNLSNTSQFSTDGFRQFNLQNPNYMSVNQDQYQNNILNNFDSAKNKLNDLNKESFSTASINIESENNDNFTLFNKFVSNNTNKFQQIQSSLVTSTNDTNEIEFKNQSGNYNY